MIGKRAVRITPVEGADTAIGLPGYATIGSSGLDVRANLLAEFREAGKRMRPGDIALIETGFCLEIPEGMEAQVRPKSGLALKHAIAVLNSPGTIDSDYRGEVKVILINHSNTEYVVKHGDPIAQIVFCTVERVDLILAESLSSTVRESGGFGSTNGQVSTKT